MSASAAERRLAARSAVHTRWGYTRDRTAATAPARAAADARFEKLADPEGTLTAQERAKRAASLRKAHYAQLAKRSAEVRRQRKKTPRGI